MRVKASEKKQETQLTNKFQIARFISLLIGIQGLFMGLMSYRENNISIFYISVGYGIAMLLVFVVMSFTKNIRFFYVISVFIVIYLEYSFLRHGGTEGFGIIWLLIVPVFCIFILELRFFIFINSLVLILLISAFWTPLKQFCYPFSQSFTSRFPLVYMLLFGFCTYLKYKIEKFESILTKQKAVLESEIQMASEMQKGYLPQNVEIDESWDLAFYNKPMAGVSGDFYDIFTTGLKLDGIGLFDISGHGISSGLISMLVKSIVHHEFYNNPDCDLWEIVNKINDRMIAEKGNIQNYLTGILIRIEENHLEFVNAGHPFPIVYHKKTDTFEFIEKDPGAIGVIGIDMVPAFYISQYLDLEKDDEIILYSDGITDVEDVNHQSYGKERFLNVLKNNIDLSAQEQMEAIFRDIQIYTEKTSINDDETVIILKKN